MPKSPRRRQVSPDDVDDRRAAKVDQKANRANNVAGRVDDPIAETGELGQIAAFHYRLADQFNSEADRIGVELAAKDKSARKALLEATEVEKTAVETVKAAGDRLKAAEINRDAADKRLKEGTKREAALFRATMDNIRHFPTELPGDADARRTQPDANPPRMQIHRS